jgi:hypothetical protein
MRIDHLPSLLLLLFAATAAGLPLPATADDAAVREHALRAGYLFNFVKFVEWPALASPGSLTVCFVGGAGIREAFASNLDSKRVGTRRLLVRDLANATATAGCDVLYLDSAVAPNRHEVAAAILTVSDSEDFVRNGGMIGLFTERNRLRFNINLENARQAGLRISSNLLQLASAVETVRS